jgi:3-hydroxyacyl-CoA dehydrogenase
MSDLVQLTRDGDIAVITIVNPPVNALSPGVPEGIGESVAAIQDDDAIKGAVLIGSGQTFIAGADIKEFGKITSGLRREGINLTDLLIVIEDSAKPVVAAIHGTALAAVSRLRWPATIA